MVHCDQCGIAEPPVVEVADDRDAASIGSDEDELNGDLLVGGNGACRMDAKHSKSDHGDHTSSERGGPGRPPRDAHRGAEPADDTAMPPFGVETPNANHDPAVEGFVQTHRMLELLDHELECRTTPIRHCEPPAAGRAAGRRRA